MHTLRLFVEGPLVQSLEACVVVALVWVIITLIRARHAPLSTALNKSIPEALGVGGILTIIAFAVPPDPGVQTTINLVPLVGLVQRLSSFDQEITLINVVGNIALFLPIGAAIGVAVPLVGLLVLAQVGDWRDHKLKSEERLPSGAP